jgi:hypothetical protein
MARGRRREQALEHLEFEREREAALRDQLVEVVTEQLAPELDRAAFAQMTPEEVEVVREALVGPAELGLDEDDPADWLQDDEPEEGPDFEGEISRLEAELAESRRRQQAYERYLEALGGAGAE